MNRLLHGSPPTRPFWPVATMVVVALVATILFVSPAVAQGRSLSVFCDGRLATLVAEPGVTLVGTAGADVIVGTDGDDLIKGLDGDDVICGLGGNDRIEAGSGSDVVFGGAGNDLLFGHGHNDEIYGGAGNDYVHAGSGADQVFGGDGNDRLYGVHGPDSIDGGAGTDAIDGGPHEDMCTNGSTQINCETAAPDQPTDCHGVKGTIFAQPGVVTNGTSGPDVIIGTSGDDVINGAGGDDRICALGGDDKINGGSGNDTLDGGPGNDTLEGGVGNDTLQGQAGADELWGQNGIDILTGGDGDDELAGGFSADQIFGGAGDDLLDGGTGVDELTGGPGFDTVIGGPQGEFFPGQTCSGEEISACVDLSEWTVSNVDITVDSSLFNVYGRFYVDMDLPVAAAITSLRVSYVNHESDATFDTTVPVPWGASSVSYTETNFVETGWYGVKVEGLINDRSVPGLPPLLIPNSLYQEPPWATAEPPVEPPPPPVEPEFGSPSLGHCYSGYDKRPECDGVVTPDGIFGDDSTIAYDTVGGPSSPPGDHSVPWGCTNVDVSIEDDGVNHSVISWSGSNLAFATTKLVVNLSKGQLSQSLGRGVTSARFTTQREWIRDLRITITLEDGRSVFCVFSPPESVGSHCFGPKWLTVSDVTTVLRRDVNFDCTYTGQHVIVYFNRDEVTDQWVRHLTLQLDEAYKSLKNHFDAPTGRVPVAIYQGGSTKDGFSPPGRIQIHPRVLGYTNNFVVHEMFHQFQWKFANVNSSIGSFLSLSWVEGSADYVACALHPTSRCAAHKSTYWQSAHLPAPQDGTGRYWASRFYTEMESIEGMSQSRVFEAIKLGSGAADAVLDMVQEGGSACYDVFGSCIPKLAKWRADNPIALSNPNHWVGLAGQGGALRFAVPSFGSRELEIATRSGRVRYVVQGCGATTEGWLDQDPISLTASQCSPGATVTIVNVDRETDAVDVFAQILG